MSSRHKSRTIALQGLYQIDLVASSLKDVLSFKWYDKESSKEDREYAEFLIRGVLDNWDFLDNLIQKHSANWEISRMSVVNRCILRLSIFSFWKEPNLHKSVVIDEALVLTGEFESDESVKFVNGILDSVLEKEVDINTRPWKSPKETDST